MRHRHHPHRPHPDSGRALRQIERHHHRAARVPAWFDAVAHLTPTRTAPPPNLTDIVTALRRAHADAGQTLGRTVAAFARATSRAARPTPADFTLH